MATALLIIPPLLKYAAGPLLGPALLAGAASAAGHEVVVADLNVRFLRQHLHLVPSARPARVHGDHARPPEGLRAAAERYLERVARAITGPAGHRERNAALTLPVSHAQVYEAALSLAQGPLGAWVGTALENSASKAPDVVGVSVLYSGQVLAGLVATIVSRHRWPSARVVWGGPHITALRDVIPFDADFGRLVDGFVFGAADATFVELLDAIDRGAPWPEAVVRAGSGRTTHGASSGRALPRFDDLDQYGVPVLTLPAQTGRGCAYGRCTYCTYPAIEGAVVDLGLDMLEQVVRLAMERSAAVSLKDSLLVPARLAQVADLVAGRVPWAGCTKLHPRLDRAFVARLAASGCRTLEFGLETLLPDSQELIAKRQTGGLLAQVLDACARAGVHPVVNLITGFPGEDPAKAEAMRAAVEHALLQAGGPGFGQVEHNSFELERLAPLAKDPRIEITGSWPWASVMDWRWRGQGATGDYQVTSGVQVSRMLARASLM
ncbi:radical SAM protein [Myxococcota bacterium]|nr:radical SAM protein [Myxococcota bacterium]